MLSDKAIAKSVNNGLSQLEHIEAVKDIQELYTKSKYLESSKDKSGAENLIIHRYTADIDNETKALITLKETIQGNTKGNKIYTLELEGLENVAKLESAQPRTLAKHSTSSRNTHDWDNVTPDVKPEFNSTIDKALLSKQELWSKIQKE